MIYDINSLLGATSLLSVFNLGNSSRSRTALMSTLLAACSSLIIGLILLYISILSLTVPHRSYFLYVRLAIAPLAIRHFWYFGYGPYEAPTLMISGGKAAVGLYFIMRVLEHSVVGLWDPNPPYWVKKAGKNGPRSVYSPPHSSRERLFYAIDLLTSVRGLSWSTNQEWNWLHHSFKSSTYQVASTRQFLMDSIKAMIMQYLLIDICDSITKQPDWNVSDLYPLSSLSVLEQFPVLISLCAGTFLSIDFGYTVTSAVCVLCGSSPDSWPPMFRSPISSTSTRDFWSYRWHYLFRRVFDRLSIPLMRITTSVLNIACKDHRRKEQIASYIRGVIIFGLSTLLHLFIMHQVVKDAYRKKYATDIPSFWDPGTLKFFMCQPLGFIIESTAILPISNWMFPLETHHRDSQQAAHIVPSVHSSSKLDTNQNRTADPLESNASTGVYYWERDALPRVFTWLFFLWAGRWWGDKWVRSGFFNKNELVVPFSVWRGLLHGKWIQY